VLASLPNDFIDDSHLPLILSLVSETSHRDADMAEAWCLVLQELHRLYNKLDTNEE
jgi:hypothetical protein